MTGDAAGATPLDRLAADLDRLLTDADEELLRLYPGERPGRQPVHTVYVPADRYDAETVQRWGATALDLFDTHAGTATRLADAVGLDPPVAEELHGRVRAKLAGEPVEDLRIDFEDGYGSPGDETEDDAARAAASALAASLSAGTAPPFTGIRVKSLEAPTRRRCLRTLDVFVSTLVARTVLPRTFVVTLPKVTSVEQAAAMVVVCERTEEAHGLPAGSLRFEIQVETPQAVLGPDGTALVARMVHATAGRCCGLHYGTYDYSASCGIAAGQQSLEHPAADHAKAVMQVAAAGTGVRLSDGSTNVLPVGDAAAVRRGWQVHARLVRRSLERGYYQGWDLHPAQLPSRFASVYAFYREGLPAAGERLRSYLQRTDSAVQDEPATARALADFVVRGLDCGALDLDEVTSLAGVDRGTLDVLARRASAG